MKRHRRWYLVLGGLLVGAVLVVALLAPHVTRLSPFYADFNLEVTDPRPPYPPSSLHPLGTDDYGRDNWSLLAYGARLSLVFAFVIMLARLLVAAPMALLAAFGPRWLDWLLGRLYVLTSAFPPLIVYIFVLGVPRLRLIGFFPNVILTVLVLTTLEWPRLAVALKGRLHALAAEQFVEGAVAAGASRLRILFVHLLPHLWPTLLHMVAAEMGRGLLNIAQLGVFGIWVGGGVLERIAAGADYRLMTAPGLPEWGTMLANSRQHIRDTPWVPLAPAAAFFVAVSGFTFLSQGLESLHVALDEWREQTTGRLSRRWRWALVVPAVAGVLWYCQGLPWGRAAEIGSLAARQSHALSARDPADYAATLTPNDANYRKELERWSADVANQPYQSVSIEPRNVKISGSKAVADWFITFLYADGSTYNLTRQIGLERILGRWYETREPYTLLKGHYVDMMAPFDPIAADENASFKRRNIRAVTLVADRAYEQVAPLFPPAVRAERPRLIVYRSPWEFNTATSGDLGQKIESGDMSYIPGELIRLAPGVANNTQLNALVRPMAAELIKHLTYERLGRQTAHPLIVGGFEFTTAEYRKNQYPYWEWTGIPFYSLPQLFTTDLGALPAKRQLIFGLQSAALLEMVSARLSSQDVLAGAARWNDPAALAAALGQSEAELTAAYEEYLFERIGKLSLLERPEWRAEIPYALTDAIAANDAVFLAKSGLKAYRTVPLNLVVRGGHADIHLLERATAADGQTQFAIGTQEWAKQGDAWVLVGFKSLFQP